MSMSDKHKQKELGNIKHSETVSAHAHTQFLLCSVCSLFKFTVCLTSVKVKSSKRLAKQFMYEIAE